MRSILLLSSLMCVLCVVDGAVDPAVAFILNDLYFSTNGDSWADHTNWNNGDPCTNSWVGIVCEGNAIQTIQLQNNGLSGTVPSSLWSIPNIVEINISSNGVYGSLDGNWSTTAIIALDVAYNKFTGTLPAAISSLTSLVTLNVNGNNLEGTLPPFQQLTSLYFLNLAENNFNGTLFDVLSSCTSLEYLDAHTNLFTGDVTADFRANLQNLRQLYVQNNQLSGVLDYFFDLEGLQYANLSHNNFSAITESIADLHSIIDLDLSYNQIASTINLGIINLAYITSLNLAHNSFSGTLPTFSATLQFLDLSCNEFIGSMTTLGNQNNIIYLDLSNNNLSGTIPDVISSFTNLSTLNLYNNSFYGALPQFLQTAPPFASINIACNAYTLPLPSWCACGSCKMCGVTCGDCSVGTSEQCDPPNAGCCSNTCSFRDTQFQCRSTGDGCHQAAYCAGGVPICDPEAFVADNTVCGTKCGTTASCSTGVCSVFGDLCTFGTCDRVSGNCLCNDTSKTYPFCYAYCGDAECNNGETCDSCYQDCEQYCASDSCLNAGCQNEAACLNGLCQCTQNWTGPQCDKVISPIIIVQNTTTPNVVQVGDDPNSVNLFLITFKQISEINPSGIVVQYIDLAINYTCATQNSSIKQQWICGSALSNGGRVNFTVALYKQPTNITFAGQTSSIASNTLKVTFELLSWPFRSVQNSLSITVDTRASQPDFCSPNPFDSGTTDSGNLLWYSIKSGSATLYGTFNEQVELDSKPKYMNIVFDEVTASVSLNLPYFWETAVIDPNYNMLIDPISKTATTTDSSTECQSGVQPPRSVPVAVIAGVTVGVICAAVLAAVAFFYWSAWRRNALRAQMKRKLTAASSINQL